MVRSKLKLIGIEQVYYNKDARVLKFQSEYDEKIPEDIRFQKFTPSANATYHVDNPKALEQFELGKCYYVDFTPVPEEVK